MKWYHFGLLSLLVCTFSGLFGWYLGGLENRAFVSSCVTIAAVTFAVICQTTAFKRKFPVFYSNARYITLYILGGLSYAFMMVVSHHYHLPHNVFLRNL